MSAMHYAGALRWKGKRGHVIEILPGWAACCSGDRARKIRQSRANTYYILLVTCKACLRTVERARASGGTL